MAAMAAIRRKCPREQPCRPATFSMSATTSPEASMARWYPRLRTSCLVQLINRNSAPNMKSNATSDRTMAAHDFGNIVTREPLDLKSSSSKEYVSFRDIGAFLRRHAWVFATCTALSLGIGAAYVTSMTPIYSATTRLVMDPEQGRIQSQDSFSGTIIIEAAEIASQVEIVKSEAIARSVISTLDLDNDAELVSGRSWQSMIHDQIRMVTALFGSEPKSSPAPTSARQEATRRTMAAFLSRVSV